MFKLNIEKAKEMHKCNLRIAREEVFKKLDAEFMKAFENGDTEKIEAVKEKKQILRDITTCEQMENATTLAQLKAFWPDILECDCPYHHE